MRRSGQAAAAGQPMTMSVDHAEAARGESIAAGLFVDGVPESIALGLTVAEGEIGLALLVGIVVGNVVEAYGAAQPIITGGHAKRFAVVLLGGIGLALAGAAILGGTVLADTSDDFVGTAAGFRSGGRAQAGPGIAPSASLIRVQTFMLTTTPTISSICSRLKLSASASWKRWNAASRSVSAARVRASA